MLGFAQQDTALHVELQRARGYKQPASRVTVRPPALACRQQKKRGYIEVHPPGVKKSAIRAEGRRAASTKAAAKKEVKHVEKAQATQAVVGAQ